MSATLNLSIVRTASFGPVAITCQRLAEDGVTLEVVPLAGWSAYAEVRKSPGKAVVLDLSPVITADDAAGLITLPKIDHTALANLPLGTHAWDLILEDPDGVRYPPLVSGKADITRTTTEPSP